MFIRSSNMSGADGRQCTIHLFYSFVLRVITISSNAGEFLTLLSEVVDLIDVSY